MSAGVLIDSCLFIDHLRAKDKAQTSLARVLRADTDFFTSTIVEYEVEVGMTPSHRELWDGILGRLTIYPFERSTVVLACKIRHQLGEMGKQIEPLDLFIAATAMVKDLPLATLNHKHFKQIDGLTLFLPEESL